MNAQTDTSQANPQGGQFAGDPALNTDESELDGLLGEPVEGDDPDAEGDPDAGDGDADAGDPDADEPDAEGDPEAGDGKKAKAATTADDAEVALEDGRKVTVKDLKDTFSTFTRKTQELAESQRTTMAQAREAVATYAQQQAQELHLISQHIEQLVAPGIDQQALQRLAYDNPEAYMQVKARLDLVRDLRGQIQGKVAALVQESQQQRGNAMREQQQAHQQLLQTEGSKLAGHKWYTDDFQNKAVAFAKKHGVPEQAARSVAYAGFVEITRKAMLYDEALARTKGGKQPGKAPANVPGASPARGSLQKTKQINTSFDRARQSGDKHDIGRYLDNVL